MATRGLFTLYDEKNKTYYFYYIKSDSLMILRGMRSKFSSAKSIKAIYRIISKAVEVGQIHIDGAAHPTSSSRPMPHDKCWPFKEFTMTVSIKNETVIAVSETWTIEPIMETMESGFEKVKKQRGAIEGINPKCGEPVKVKKVKSPKPVKAKKPKAETGDEKPKRKNPYILFSNEKRSGVKEANPEMKPKDVIKNLSAMWKALSDEEKTPYKERAMEASSEFFEAKAAKEASKVEKPKRKAGRPKKSMTTEELEAKLIKAQARAEAALAMVAKLQRQVFFSRTLPDQETTLPKRKRSGNSFAGMDIPGSDHDDCDYSP